MKQHLDQFNSFDIADTIKLISKVPFNAFAKTLLKQLESIDMTNEVKAFGRLLDILDKNALKVEEVLEFV